MKEAGRGEVMAQGEVMAPSSNHVILKSGVIVIVCLF